MQLAWCPSTRGPRRRWIAALIASVVTAAYKTWPASDPTTPPEPIGPVTYHLVPLLGEPLALAVDDHDGDVDRDDTVATEPGGCVPFLEPLTAHPHWSIAIVRGDSGCKGTRIDDAFTVSFDGSVRWSVSGMPARVLRLTPDELAAIRGLDRVECARTERVGYGESWIRIAPGGIPDADGGAQISMHSATGERVDTTFDAAIERYVDERLAGGPITMQLTAVRPGKRGVRAQIDLDARGQVTVRRGRRVISRHALSRRDRVELLDLAIARAAAPGDLSRIGVRGDLRGGATAIPVVLEPLARGPLPSELQVALGKAYDADPPAPYDDQPDDD